MENETEEKLYDEERLKAADPDGLYLFMLEPYPYMMTPDQVAFRSRARQDKRFESS